MLNTGFELTVFVYILSRPGRESDSEAEVEHGEKLRQVKAVLEEVINSLDLYFI